MGRALSIGEIPSSLRREYEPAGGGPHRLRSRDGRRLLDLQLRLQGVRDLHAAFLQLARDVSGAPRAARGILAAWAPGPSNDRIAREWRAAVDLLKPAIARRMALVVARPEGCLSLPEDRDLGRIGEALRSHLGKIEAPPREHQPGISRKLFEVFKVLLHQALLGRGPVAIGELMRRTGCSYPTVAEAIRRLEKSQEIARRSNRSVQLKGFPEKTWPEILALSGTLRGTRCYADSSGRPADPMALLRRLQQAPRPHVAVGGVQAARHYDLHFDLRGLPRLDLAVHVAPGAGDLNFLGPLDPALKRVDPGAPGVVLAVHPLSRAEACFEKNPGGRIDWADPVETLLDLHELRLTGQAERLLKRLGDVSAS